MNSPSKDLVSLLVADVSLSLTLGTNLFVSLEPNSPNNCVTLYDGVSSPPQLTLTRGENYYYDAVQIRVRNSDGQSAYALSFLIMQSLHGRGQVTINGTLYSVIYCSSGPVTLGYDDNGRCVYVLNFEIQRR